MAGNDLSFQESTSLSGVERSTRRPGPRGRWRRERVRREPSESVSARTRPGYNVAGVIAKEALHSANDANNTRDFIQATSTYRVERALRSRSAATVASSSAVSERVVRRCSSMISRSCRPKSTTMLAPVSRPSRRDVILTS